MLKKTALLSIFIYMLSVSYSFAAPVELDTSFGSNGYTALSGEGIFYDLAQTNEADGRKILTIGTTATDDILIAKFNTNGTLDSNFGTNGIIRTDVSGSGSIDSARALQYLSDGSFFICGATDGNALILKYNADGTLDTTFGNNGHIILTTLADSIANDITTNLTGGKILLAGTSESHIYIARLNSDGSLDNTYGTDGIYVRNLNTTGLSILVTSGGHYLSGGTLSTQTFVLNTDSSGSTTEGYGLGPGQINVMIQESPGVVYMGGYRNSDSYLSKTNETPETDLPWAYNGRSVHSYGTGQSSINSIILSGDYIITTGNVGDSYVVARYNTSDGSVDTTFGSSGINVFALNGQSNKGIQLSDGTIVMAGYTNGNDATIAKVVYQTIPAGVDSTTPASDDTGVPVSTTVSATFDKDLDESTVTTDNFSLVNEITGASVPGSIAYNNKVVTFTPDSNLAPLNIHKATFTTGLKDSTGTALSSAYTWSFTTGTYVDNVKPTVTESSVQDGESGVQANATLTVTFSKEMDPTTINKNTVQLAGGENYTVSYDEATKTATLTPQLAFIKGSNHVLIVTTNAKDTSGNELSQRTTWHFSVELGGSDTDNDGIIDSIDEFPADSKKVTFPAATNGETLELDLPAGEGHILRGTQNVVASSEDINQLNKPETVDFEWGLTSYQILTDTIGAEVEVTMTLPESVGDDVTVYKSGVDGFSEYKNATISGRTITLTLKDGGSGDDDGVANGIIVDPVGIGVSSGGSSSSSGCMLNPSAGFSIDIISMLAVGIFGMFIRRRRR